MCLRPWNHRRRGLPKSANGLSFVALRITVEAGLYRAGFERVGWCH
jgi:hypothetical protein